MRHRRAIALALAFGSALLLVVLPLVSVPAEAVPSFARRYGLTCSTCHTAFPALNATGRAFKLSGYRRLNGVDIKPTTEDIQLAMGALAMPTIPPLSLVAATGFDYQTISRRSAEGTTARQAGSSIDLNFVELFIATPLGEHLSTFFAFPLFETKAPANDSPTGPWGANATDVTSKRNIGFTSEVPGFELGKVMWNSLLPMSWAPPDSLNIKVGVDQLPFAFSPEANRMSVRPYLVYRRRALDLLSSTQPDTLFSASTEADRLHRPGEPQLQVALNGLVVPFGKLDDLGKLETLALEYEVGVTNGSNKNSDPNTQKDVFGRIGMQWWGQRLGVFGYWSADIYDDFQRADGAITNGGILGGAQRANRFASVGPDALLSLEPLNIPVWLETQILFNRESDPTGFGKSFSWWGGFSQLNGTIPVRMKFLQWITAYARYEWLRGDRFDDTTLGGVTGVVRPRENQAVGGLQWFILENMKIITEYSWRQFANKESAPSHQKLTDNFFTVRVQFGF